MSRLGDILDAVLVELNAITWNEDVVLARTYLPEVDRADLATLHVAVVPNAVAFEPITRNQNRYTYKIDVGLQKRVDPADTATIDGLLGKLETIGEMLVGSALSAMPAAVCVGVESEPVYSVEHLAQKRVFTGVVTLEIHLAV